MKEPARHILKTWSGPFHAVRRGQKTHEFRRNDRGYEVGDMLVLREWTPKPDHPDGGFFTSATELIRWVTYVGRGFGIPEDFVALSISERRPVKCEIAGCEEISTCCDGADAPQTCALHCPNCTPQAVPQ